MATTTTPRRSRWFAFGAAMAVICGAGGVLTSSAAGDSAPSSLVTIVPCRLFDTRPAPDNIGGRATPVAAGETLTVTARGASGNCTIPTNASGLSLNVAIVNPTAASFLTVFPGGATRPLSANLNWVAGQAPTPNAVTASLSADGKVSFFNFAGTVDLVVDLVGYYLPSSAGPAGPAGPAGARGVSSFDVLPSGTTVKGEVVFDGQTAGNASSDLISIELPARAPVALTDATIGFSPESNVTMPGETDPSCTGTPQAPTAPAGKVCIYLLSKVNVDLARVVATPGILGDRAFWVAWNPSPSTAGNDYLFYATYAYTAP